VFQRLAEEIGHFVRCRYLLPTERVGGDLLLKVMMLDAAVLSIRFWGLHTEQCR
jgi:hypothetical protein